MPSGWLPLGTYRWFTPALILYLPVYLLFANALFQGVNIFTAEDRLPSTLWWFGGVFVSLPLLFLVARRLRVGHPFVNFDTNELRRGRRIVPISSIDWARVVVGGRLKNPGFALAFGAGKSFEMTAAIRLGAKRPISAEDRSQLLEVLRRTSVVMPQDKYDPTGKFTKANFPAHLTRDEAIRFVTDPPATLNAETWGRVLQD
ncbi:MAG: hypothetical protein JWQ43_843 [Glaciihabitans sp.]|nr:hypothetical protein [Glaciihabitans sp.]